MLLFDDAHALLLSFGRDDAPWIRHCIAVSKVAAGVAKKLKQAHAIDDRLLIVGALLHDIGRSKTQDPIQHGVEGYRLLTGLGHHAEAFICASHILCGMPGHEAVLHGLPEQDFFPRTLEERLVPLIDSVVELDTPTTVEARCSSIERRYRANPVFLTRFERAAEFARSLLEEMKDRFGVDVEKAAVETLGNGSAT